MAFRILLTIFLVSLSAHADEDQNFLDEINIFKKLGEAIEDAKLRKVHDQELREFGELGVFARDLEPVFENSKAGNKKFARMAQLLSKEKLATSTTGKELLRLTALYVQLGIASTNKSHRALMAERKKKLVLDVGQPFESALKDYVLLPKTFYLSQGPKRRREFFQYDERFPDLAFKDGMPCALLRDPENEDPKGRIIVRELRTSLFDKKLTMGHQEPPPEAVVNDFRKFLDGTDFSKFTADQLNRLLPFYVEDALREPERIAQRPLQKLAQGIVALAKAEYNEKSPQKARTAAMWETARTALPEFHQPTFGKMLTGAFQAAQPVDSCIEVCNLLEKYDKWDLAGDPGRIGAAAPTSRLFAYLSLQVLFLNKAIPYCQLTATQERRARLDKLQSSVTIEWDYYRNKLLKNGSFFKEQDPNHINKLYAKTFSLLAIPEKTDGELNSLLERLIAEDYANPVDSTEKVDSRLDALWHYAFNLIAVPKTSSPAVAAVLRGSSQKLIDEMELAHDATGSWNRAPYFFGGKPDHELEAASRNVAVWLALYLRDETGNREIYRGRLLSALENFSDQLGPLIAHAIRGGTHWGGKGTAPYYLYPGFSLAMAAADIIERDHPDDKNRVTLIRFGMMNTLSGLFRTDGLLVGPHKSTYGDALSYIVPLAGLSLLASCDDPANPSPYGILDERHLLPKAAPPSFPTRTNKPAELAEDPLHNGRTRRQ